MKLTDYWNNVWLTLSMVEENTKYVDCIAKSEHYDAKVLVRFYYDDKHKKHRNGSHPPGDYAENLFNLMEGVT